MMHILNQIVRWLMQPKVWRFIGFASAVVGLLCYALSSSFNYLFGEWNLLKIFLYSVFSFIICMVILYAKLFQHSRSLRFKAHTAFLVLTITSVYSFLFDKVMNGKPDAYSLISCASFAIMSMSLSRQTQCGFEIDLLYFFLGCLIVQLMKIKLQLFILGAGFSYSLIILRSFFSSIDARGDDQYSQLQDGNSVVLCIDSLQLTNTDIASVSSSNSIDSPQLGITIDISSVMEQLGKCLCGRLVLRKLKSVTEIRTIVLISPTPHVESIDKMPPKDGFIWKKYGKKEIPGVKYPRSYYRCSHMNLYACRAKKKVQQLGDNPNVFEVTYNGAHSCHISLTIPSLFLAARRISKDMTPTTMPVSTSYSEWLSSGTPAKYIDSIPTAKLAAPEDGGHHPMMDNVRDYLVSAIRSQQIYAVNGDEEFSPQTEGTMELLESILASKSEKYVDASLRHFFMMNNWRYLEVTNNRMELDGMFGDVWLQRNREKVQQKIELYKKESWDKVLEFLKLDINDSMEINFATDLMKVKLNLFNIQFTETCRVQCTWSVHDWKLRREIISSLKNTLLPAYGIFIGKFQDLLKNNAYKYIEYGLFDIVDVLDSLFLGKQDR